MLWTFGRSKAFERWFVDLVSPRSEASLDGGESRRSAVGEGLKRRARCWAGVERAAYLEMEVIVNWELLRCNRCRRKNTS